MNERIMSHVLGLSFLLSVILAGVCMISPPEKTEMRGTPSEIMIKNISVDDYSVKGENEQNFSEVPQRVIAIGMEEVEMVLAFADMDQILGIYGFNDLQDFLKPEYKEKMKGVNILSWGEINRERLIELNPDLIVAEQCSYTPGALQSTDFWNDRNVKTYVPLSSNSPEKHLREETIEAELRYIRDFGRIFRREQRADAFIADIQGVLDFFDENRGNRPERRVMVVENFGKNIASYDKTKLAGQIITRLGGVVPVTAPIIGKEDIIEENPDILFVVCSDGSHGESMRFFADDPIFREMECIKNSEIYSIELESIYSPGIRIKDGIERIGLGMYPDLRSDYQKLQKDSINPSYIDWLRYKDMSDFKQES